MTMTSYTPPLPIKTTTDRTRTAVHTALGLVAAGAMAILLGSAVAIGELDALFISLSLLAAVFILADFRVGAILLVVVMPIASSSLFPHSIGGITGLNPLNLLLLATLVSCLARRQLVAALMDAMPRSLIWLYVVPIVFAGLLGSFHVDQISVAFRATDAIAFDNASGYLRDMLVRPMFLVLFALLIGVAMTRLQRFESLLVPMLASVWVMSLMAIGLVYLSGASLDQLSSARARQFFQPLGMHANDLGRLYAIAYALMLFTFAKAPDRLMKLALLASMGMVVIALTLTFSRGAFVGFIIVNLVFVLSRPKITSLLIGALVLAAGLMILPAAVYERLAMGWGQGINVITAGRVDEIWMPLLPELLKSPFYGNGLGSIMWSTPMRAGLVLQVTHPHNAYLQAALDIGLIGLVLLCTFFAKVWTGFRRLSRDPQVSPLRQGFYEGAAAGLVSFMITGFAGSSLVPVPEQSFLWLAIGMMYGERACRAGN